MLLKCPDRALHAVFHVRRVPELVCSLLDHSGVSNLAMADGPSKSTNAFGKSTIVSMQCC